MSNLTNYAEVIALRISDEWSGKEDFPEDATLLQDILGKLLIDNPTECEKLIGTGIIEDNYFQSLSSP